MSKPQYVLIGHPYAEVQAEAVGPFRSRERADAAVAKIESAAPDGAELEVYVVRLRTPGEYIEEHLR